jgi:hypothetical protein
VIRGLPLLVGGLVGCVGEVVDPPRTQAPTLCDETYADRTVGLKRCSPGVYEGYTLFSPNQYTATYLIDVSGQIVHQWDTDYRPGMSAYLLDSGNLLRTAQDNPGERFFAGGAGGRVQEITWDGEVVWEIAYNSDTYFLHHDIEPMPSGHILMLAWTYVDTQTAIEAGRDPEKIDGQGVWVDGLIEVDPSTDEIVWSWSVFDHLIQDVDPDQDNFGVVAEAPTQIDFNVVTEGGGPVGGMNPDWNHLNSVDYNPRLDHIVVSAAHQNELWVIDRASGEIVYRWGQPQNYGFEGAETLSGQHDPEWVDSGLPGGEHLLIFDNGVAQGRSRIVEIAPPVSESGVYERPENQAWGPESPTWIFEAGSDFFSAHLGGADRLPNGNTLVCEGVTGRFFEVTSDGDVVWEYVNPVNADGPVRQGEEPGGAGVPANGVFRADKIPLDHPGLAGRDLTPLGTIER